MDGGFDVAEGELVLLENCRFNKGEKKSSDELSKKYAALCDVFVMDAFGTAHRAEASTHGVAKYAPVAAAGILLTEELEALTKALLNPARPMVAIVGGSKVSTKLTVLESLSEKVRSTGGRWRYRQYLPQGCRQQRWQIAVRRRPGSDRTGTDGKNERTRRKHPHRGGCGRSARISTANEPAVLKNANDVAEDDMIFDIGPKSAQELADIIMKAGTVVWNGPVGVFEFDQFGEGTKTIAMAIAETKAFTLAGGGDTIAAIQKYDIYDKVSYISTAGGAFLEFLEGKILPAVEILEQRAAK